MTRLLLACLFAALALPASAQLAPQATIGYLSTSGCPAATPCFIQYGATLPVSGTISATNPSVGPTGSGAPADATFIGAQNGGNLVGLNATSGGSLETTTLPSADAAIAITPVVAGSAASSSVLKGSAGNLYDAYAECTAACWLMIFNATAAPSNGSTTAGVAASNMQDCIPIAAGGIGGVSYGSGPPERFSTGITAAISSTTCATLTLATTGFIHGRVQ